MRISLYYMNVFWLLSLEIFFFFGCDEKLYYKDTCTILHQYIKFINVGEYILVYYVADLIGRPDAGKFLRGLLELY